MASDEAASPKAYSPLYGHYKNWFIALGKGAFGNTEEAMNEFKNMKIEDVLKSEEETEDESDAEEGTPGEEDEDDDEGKGLDETDAEETE